MNNKKIEHHYGWVDADDKDRPKKFNYLNEEERAEKIRSHVMHTAISFNKNEIKREFPSSLEHEVENPYVSLFGAPIAPSNMLISSLGEKACFSVTGFGFVHTEKNGKPKNEYEVLRGFLNSNDPYIEEVIENNKIEDGRGGEKQIPFYMVISHSEKPGELDFKNIKFFNYGEIHSFDGVCSFIMDDGAILKSKADVDDFIKKIETNESEDKSENKEDARETTFANLAEETKFDPEAAKKAKEEFSASEKGSV